MDRRFRGLPGAHRLEQRVADLERAGTALTIALAEALKAAHRTDPDLARRLRAAALHATRGILPQCTQRLQTLALPLASEPDAALDTPPSSE